MENSGEDLVFSYDHALNLDLLNVYYYFLYIVVAPCILILLILILITVYLGEQVNSFVCIR